MQSIYVYVWISELFLRVTIYLSLGRWKCELYDHYDYEDMVQHILRERISSIYVIYRRSWRSDINMRNKETIKTPTLPAIFSSNLVEVLQIQGKPIPAGSLSSKFYVYLHCGTNMYVCVCTYNSKALCVCLSVHPFICLCTTSILENILYVYVYI